MKEVLILLIMFLLISYPAYSLSFQDITDFFAPAYNSINFSLCSGYTVPSYNSINFTLGDSDSCDTNCWVTISTGEIYVPTNCSYYIPSATTSYAT